MEEGIREFLAACAAGVLVVMVADFIYTNSTTSGWFKGPARPAAGATATNATGGLPTAASAAPPPVTC